MNKTRTVRLVAKYLIYAGAVASTALIISGVCESSYITVNWVKCLIGISLFGALDFTYSWLFPKKSNNRKEDAR